ncbi:hypothetical protein BV25DRAFT_1805777 [Artomyces pyxidatus]|uniref:Uncharacterized protein n=1 Tax=Artomyces pyxidatus TaxID=48021 RepID=A0ACB8SYP4_9AGAM|nr:hypothetical protein BV25DRAFT_1805777 [Artomyces pyxidatus]
MKRYGVLFHPDTAQIRCLAHVVNLVVQKILSTAADAADPDVEDYYETLNKHLPFHYDPADDEDVTEFESQEAADRDEEEKDVLDVSEEAEEEDAYSSMSAIDKVRTVLISMIARLRATCRKIVSSPARRSAFRKLAVKHYDNSHLLNGHKINRLMPIRDAINAWVFDRDDLHALMLTPAEWKVLESFGSVLEVFTQVTLNMSRSKTPTLPWVLPMYEHMRLSLTSRVSDESLPLSLREGIAAGLEKLMHYYDLARGSQFPVIATICHPALRIAWFDKLGKDQRDKAWALFKHVYDEYAKAMPPPQDTPATSATHIPDPNDFLAIVAQTTALPDSNIEEVHQRTELDRWRGMEGGRGDIHYPLVWWKVRHTPESVRAWD